MTEEKTQTDAQVEATATAIESGPKVIKMGQHGSGNFTLDSFHEAMGTEVEDASEEEGEEELEEGSDEAEGEASGDEDSDAEEEDSEDGEEDLEESDEESEDDDDDVDEEEEEKPAKKGSSAIRAKTPDGEEYEIPGDIIIYQKIDGEMHELPLREHLNIVAGEKTVDQRLTMLASWKHDVQKHVDGVNSQLDARLEQDKKIVDLIGSGQVDQALFYIADLMGTSPVEMMKQLNANVANKLKSFRGKTRAEVENYYHKLDADYRKSVDQKRKEREDLTASENAFLEETTQMLQEKGISIDEFTTVHSEMLKRGELKNITDNREIRSQVAKTTLLAKRAVRMVTAIDQVNPKLRGDSELIRRLEKAIDFGDYSDDELLELVQEYSKGNQKTRASNLNRKASKTKKAEPKKQSGAKQTELKGKNLKSLSDLNKAFGFSY